ncbi:MAG: hypothetical protein KGJ59_14355 [Bacteroidota bacterium]|nr:hypothetical protein [Bacteroidota bacterium]
MERLINKAENFQEAEAWDVLQQTEMTHEQHQKIARELKEHFFGAGSTDVRENRHSKIDPVGIMKSNFSKDVTIFARLMKHREEADDNSSYVFTKEEYADFKKEAVAVHAAVKGLLAKESFL